MEGIFQFQFIKVNIIFYLFFKILKNVQFSENAIRFLKQKTKDVLPLKQTVNKTVFAPRDLQQLSQDLRSITPESVGFNVPEEGQLESVSNVFNIHQVSKAEIPGWPPDRNRDTRYEKSDQIWENLDNMNLFTLKALPQTR